MLEDIDDSDPEYGLTARDIQALPSTEEPQTNHNPWSFFFYGITRLKFDDRR